MMSGERFHNSFEKRLISGILLLILSYN